MLDNIRKAIANLGVRRDRDIYPRFFTTSDFSFGEGKKSSGIDKGFNMNAYVYAIVDTIATTARNIPVKVMEKIGDEWEEVTEGEFYDLVHNPNEEENYGSMLYQSLVFQLTNGNSFEYSVKPTGFKVPTKRYNLFPQHIRIGSEETPTGFKPTEYKYKFGQKEYKFKVEEILHIKRFNPSIDANEPLYGLSPLTAAYRTLIASNEVQLAEASIIKNRGVSGVLTNTGNRPLTQEEMLKAQATIKQRIGGGENFGGVAVTNGAFNLVSLGMSPTDLKLLESGELKLRDLCTVYHVSSRMFNDPQGATFNNVKEDNKRYYTQAVIPPLEIYLENFNEYYSPIFLKETGKKYKLKMDTSNIAVLQENDLTKEQKNELRLKAIQSVITGISEGVWSAESGVKQLIYTFGIEEEEARNLIDNAESGND